MDEAEKAAEITAGRTLTAEEAERMLLRLRGFYNEPVMPITRYCDGLREWANALADRSTSLRRELYPDLEGPYEDPKTQAAYALYREETADEAYRALAAPRWAQVYDLKLYEKASEITHHVFTMIRKSSLLDRLLYAGEKLRTRKCPTHNGHWSGLEHDGNVCPHGCQLTGWLPEP